MRPIALSLVDHSRENVYTVQATGQESLGKAKTSIPWLQTHTKSEMLILVIHMYFNKL